MNELTKKVDGLRTMIKAAITMAHAEGLGTDLVDMLYLMCDWNEELFEAAERCCK